MITVDVQYAYTDPEIPARKNFNTWVRTTLQGLRESAELTVRIVDKTEATKLNEKWRNSNGPVNVLSFPAIGIEDMVPDLLGDIVICAPVVYDEATRQKKPLLAHWAHMVIHGTLHLAGYEHDQKNDAEAMELQEIRIMNLLGFDNPYL